MKKKVLFGSIVSALILGGAVAVGATDGDDLGGKKKLSINEAGKIAISEKGGIIESIELEREHNKVFYEVDIENNSFDDDDDVYVDAYSGEIYVDDDFDDDDDSKNMNQDVATQEKEKMISREEAIKIAENAVDGTVYSIEKDEDDGFYQYELELKSKRGEVEVEIDAISGKILEIDYDDMD